MDEEEFIFIPESEVKACNYRPYPFWRIKRILEKFYDCRLENMPQGYKCNRRPNYHEIYRMVQNYDNKVVGERLTLEAIRKMLARAGYPLEDKDDRNVEAEAFLQYVEELKNKAK